jgi:hypothetical protein
MPDSNFYESAHIALDSVCRAKGSISQEYNNDNTTRTYVGKCLEAIEYNRDHSPTMSVRDNIPVYSQHVKSPREEFLEKVFEEARSFTSHSPTTSTDSQGGRNGGQTNTTPLSSLPSNDSQGTTAPNKKRHRDDDEEEWDGPNQAPKRERPGSKDTYGQHRHRGRRLACHFHLFKKEVYCKNNGTGKKYETCSGPGWSAMHYLKLVK